MKNIYFLILLSFFANGVSAQNAKSCYDDWKTFFEERGAFPVEDGVHDEIIVTIRKGNETECVMGRVVVKGGLVIELSIYFEDDSYERMDYKFKKQTTWSIHNGMTITRITENDEMINIFFTNKVKPKEKKKKVAPRPNFD